MSLPVRGAWIEISARRNPAADAGSLPVRGAWIEILLPDGFLRPRASLPVRGAWIEISSSLRAYAVTHVAPRAGSVD